MDREQKLEMLNKCKQGDPRLAPFMAMAINGLPEADNPDELEAVANVLWDAYTIHGERITAKEARKRWLDDEDDAMEELCGFGTVHNMSKEQQKVNDEKPEVQVDEAMTRAALENRFRDMWIDKILSGDPEALDQFGKVTDEKLVGKFRGLVPDEKKTGILEKMNRLADIVAMTNGVTVPEGSGILNSESNNAVVMLDFCNTVFMPAGESLKALHKLMSMADDFCISGRGGNIRMSFGLHELWKEYRELQPWEMDEEN